MGEEVVEEVEEAVGLPPQQQTPGVALRKFTCPKPPRRRLVRRTKKTKTAAENPPSSLGGGDVKLNVVGSRGHGAISFLG